MTWKLIDTIPNDGIMVLLWDGINYELGNKPPNCFIGRWEIDKNKGNWCGHSLGFKPTHWMELPKPPTEVIHAPTVKKKRLKSVDLNLIDSKIQECTCGNPEMGFNCMCNFVKNNPGIINYCCEYCGLYTASRPRCNRCEAEEEEKPKKLKTIIVQCYDPKCTKAPYLFIELERFTVNNFPKDITGVEQAKFLSKLMSDKGYSFRFYSSDESNGVEVVAHNYGSPGSELYPINHLKP